MSVAEKKCRRSCTQEIIMEPITLCGAVILAVGLWVEFESIIMKVVNAFSNSKIITVIKSTPAKQRPLYVNYMTGTGN
jgi:hypothetical protein